MIKRIYRGTMKREMVVTDIFVENNIVRADLHDGDIDSTIIEWEYKQGHMGYEIVEKEQSSLGMTKVGFIGLEARTNEEAKRFFIDHIVKHSKFSGSTGFPFDADYVQKNLQKEIK